MKPVGFALFMVLLTLAGVRAWAADPAEVDTLGVAAVLLRDGNLEKADKVLEAIDPRSPKLDQSRYHTLRGLLALRQGRFLQAEEALKAAQAAGQADPTVSAYLAQALYSQQKWKEVTQLLIKFPRMNSFPDLFGMLSQAQWNLQERSSAVDTIDRALRTFPERRSFRFQKIGYLLELGLFQGAAELGTELLERSANDPAVPLTVGEALRRAGQARLALTILETAKLRFPDSPKITLALGQAYADLGHPATAARLVEAVAVQDARHLADAVELYRRAGQFSRALYLNAQLLDSATKAKQRFSLLIDAQRFEEAMALRGRLERLGLLVEDRWKYAAAFSAYRIQAFDQAQDLLTGIAEPAWFNRAVQLRRAIEVGRADPIPYF